VPKHAKPLTIPLDLANFFRGNQSRASRFWSQTCHVPRAQKNEIETKVLDSAAFRIPDKLTSPDRFQNILANKGDTVKNQHIERKMYYLY